MAGHHAEHAQQDATLRTMALRTVILNTFSVRAAPPQAASYGAAAVPSKTMCRQTLTTLDGTERHHRFYLAVVRSGYFRRLGHFFSSPESCFARQRVCDSSARG